MNYVCTSFLSLDQVPCVGLSIGVERIFSILENRAKVRVCVCVCARILCSLVDVCSLVLFYLPTVTFRTKLHFNFS